MGKPIVAVGKHALRQTERPDAEVEVLDATPRVGRLGPFVSFQYSYTELSSVNGKTRVTSRKTKLEDGKLVSESLDGELERGAYEQAVSQAQQHFYDQTSLFLRAMSALLPFSRK